MTRENNEPVHWNEYVNPKISGEYESDLLRHSIVEGAHHIVLQSSSGAIGWRYSRDVGRDTRYAEDTLVERFTLDFDHHKNGQVEAEQTEALLKDFNETIYRLFRWCLTDEGLKLFTPTEDNDERINP